MFKRLFNKKISPSCEYCSVGYKTNSNIILCVKYGIISSEHYCKKFRYAPLKRIPKKQKLNFEFKKEDFSI